MHDVDALVDLATFATVVRAGSFTAAGAALGVSKSVVSRRVAALEERYGTRLLNRTTRRMEVTEVGAEVYARAATVLREAEEAENAATAMGGVARGTLRVNASAALFRWITPRLGSLLDAHPGLRLELIGSSWYLDVVGSGFDVTLRVGGALPDASLIARRIATVRLVVCAAPAYLAKHGTPVSAFDLRDHACLRYTPVPPDREWQLAGPEGTHAVPVDGPLSTDDPAVLTAAAIAGLGLVVLPDFEAQDALEAGSLVPVLRDHTLEPRSLYAMFPHRTHVAPKVTAFVDWLANALAGCPT